MIVATYSHNNFIFGLASEDLEFSENYLNQYHVVFSLTGNRSHCSPILNCSSCPFAAKHDNDPNCQNTITERDHYHLSLFGISKESHPEYFLWRTRTSSLTSATALTTTSLLSSLTPLRTYPTTGPKTTTTHFPAIFTAVTARITHSIHVDAVTTAAIISNYLTTYVLSTRSYLYESIIPTGHISVWA